jgi:hypothetical protein
MLTRSAVGAPLAATSEGQGKSCPYAPANLADRDCYAKFMLNTFVTLSVNSVNGLAMTGMRTSDG